MVDGNMNGKVGSKSVSTYKKKKKPVNKERTPTVYEKYSRVVSATLNELNAHHGENVQYRPRSGTTRGTTRGLKKNLKGERTKRRRKAPRKKTPYKGEKKPTFVKKL